MGRNHFLHNLEEVVPFPMLCTFVLDLLVFLAIICLYLLDALQGSAVLWKIFSENVFFELAWLCGK